MSWSVDSREPACPLCRDYRNVTKGGGRTEPCPNCGPRIGEKGHFTPEAYDEFRLEHTRATRPRPSLHLENLSEDELVEFRKLKADYPDATTGTVLSWLEGRRYDPAKDPEAVAECERRMTAWRAGRASGGA